MKFLLICAAFFIAILATGCHIPLLYLMKACEYKKDVSTDPERGFLVGKEFILKKDIVLYKYYDNDEFFLDNEILKISSCDKNGQWKSVLEDRRMIPFSELIPAGTKIEISQILVEAMLGEERPIKYIRAQFTNCDGKLITADVSNLFLNRYGTASDDWNFQPMPNLLLEAGCSEE